MTKIAGPLFALALFAGAAIPAGQAPEPPKPVPEKNAPQPDKKTVKELMEKKLQYSQQLLAALVKNDLETAAKRAHDLQRVRKEAAWHILKTDVYKLWSDEFTASADRVIKAAKDRNPEAAKMAYLEMTMTCFRCHTYVRDMGDIRFEPAERQ